MNEEMLKANIYKTIRAAGLVGGGVAMATSGHITDGQWVAFLGGLSAVVSFAFSLYDTYIVDLKINSVAALTNQGTKT